MTGQKSLLIRGGTVVRRSGVERADILVENGRISAVSPPGRLRGEAIVDATGLFVLPGLVDAHVHVRDPGLTHKEDFASATAAAVIGGVTTIMVMPYDDPLTDSAAHLEEKAAVAEGRAFADFALQGLLGPGNLDRARELVEAGAVSLEVGLADAPAGFGVANHADLRRVLKAGADAGAVVAVYCEDGALVEQRTAELRESGRFDPAAFIEAKHESGEILAATAVAALAQELGGRVHLRQVSTADAMLVVQRYRARGADLSLEVTPHHLMLTADDQIAGGADLKVSPPLRSARDVDLLRTALTEGQIDMVATDHAPHAPAEKASGATDIWAAPGGFPGLETLLGVMLEVAGPDGAALIARVCSDAPAQRFGLGHRKGAIEVGLDADLVLVDPHSPWTPNPATQRTKARSAPFAGRELPGRSVCTILRGRVVARNGELVGEPTGQWVRPSKGETC